MSYFYGSFFENALSQIVGYDTAYDIWVALNEIYASASISQISTYMTLIQNIKKGELTTM